MERTQSKRTTTSSSLHHQTKPSKHNANIFNLLVHDPATFVKYIINKKSIKYFTVFLILDLNVWRQGRCKHHK